MKRYALLIIILLFFCAKIFPLSKVVFGYYPTWYNGDGTLPASSISYNKISHIGIAFALANSNGTLSLDANFITCMQAILPDAHSNGGRVILSVGELEMEHNLIAQSQVTEQHLSIT